MRAGSTLPRGGALALCLAGLLGLPTGARAQEPGSLVLSGRVTAFPALRTIGLGGEIHAHRRFVVGTSVRGISSDIPCTGTRPPPCAPDGTGIGLVARVQSIATRSGWPYVEGTVGMHRYASTDEWKPFIEGNAGFGWYFGRASFRLGLDVGWIDADPPDAEWGVGGTRDGSYDHLVIGLLAALGVRVR